MSQKKGFASDNYSGVDPAIMDAIIKANQGHVPSYGNDVYTKKAIKVFEEHFGNDIEVYFVFLGTGANVLGLKAITKSFQTAICADTAH